MTSGAIPGIPAEASQRLVETLAAHPGVAQIWLYGSRAMGRERPGSDIDLSLEGMELTHRDLLLLMDQLDDLLLAWKVDLSRSHQLPAELEAHLQPVGIPLLSGNSVEINPA